MRAAGIISAVSSIAIAALLAMPAAPAQAQQGDPAIRIGASDFGGVVTGPNGPEAGVWVIAETTDLPTKFAKIVVTDDHGRYVMPDLPKANYEVWVRGYGLVDSAEVESAPGKIARPDRGARRRTRRPRPSTTRRMYWYSMLKIPPAERVSRHRRQGQRHRRDDEDPGALDRHAQELAASRAMRSASARRATIPAELGQFENSHRCLGRGASSPARPWRTWR